MKGLVKFFKIGGLETGYPIVVKIQAIVFSLLCDNNYFNILLV